MASGPVEAVRICNEIAPGIAARFSNDSVLVGRASQKARDKNNKPEKWMEDVINHYLENDDKLPQVVEIDDKRIGYAEPIYIQPVCMNCHGDAIDPEIKSAIKELYPEDKATGFKLGEFRGIFWTEFIK